MNDCKINHQSETMKDDIAVQTYPADVSYEKLKNRADSFSVLYRLWVDIIYILCYTNFWWSIVYYPLIAAYIFFCTQYWYLMLLYVLWIYCDRETPYNGGRKIKSWKTSIISKYTRDYYPTGLVKTADLSADKNYLFAAFPHGVLCSHVCTNFIHDTEIFQQFYPHVDLYFASLDGNFYSPIARDVLLSTGMVSVSERSLFNVLTGKPNSGTGCLIVVGGAAESFYADTDEYKLVLKNRKGFVRIALQTGASLVPVFGFGENQLFNLAKNKWLLKFQNFIYKHFGFAPIIILGRGLGSFKFQIPKRLPLITVVGKPIDLPKIEHPTKEEVTFYHQKFKDELYAIFEKYKTKYDPLGNDAKLIYV